MYELTGWETPDWYDLDPDGKPEEYLCTTEDKIDENDYVPFYTSDYLLEKLLPITSIQLKRKANGDIRLFYFPEKPDYATYDYDTPLKCLLALTIALSEAGELK